ncbi:hypothetical protein KM043_009548 [Ampulex compressa]|nr:hypothetical protein KM043_009548 [Ampulex compressa]
MRPRQIDRWRRFVAAQETCRRVKVFKKNHASSARTLCCRVERESKLKIGMLVPADFPSVVFQPLREFDNRPSIRQKVSLDPLSGIILYKAWKRYLRVLCDKK